MKHPILKSDLENPFSFALRKLGMTRVEFGRIADLGKPYLLRLSQGRHANIGAVAMHHLYDQAKKRGVDLDGEIEETYGVETIEEAWDAWVYDHRRKQSIPSPARGGDNPFARLVKAAGGVSRMAALLAVSDPLVERYAKGVTATMPGPIRDALLDVGYPHVDDLDREVQKWHSRH